MSDDGWLEIGKKAPAFRLKDQDGNLVALSQFKGQAVVVYFYPKDDTPGCTKEACAFRDQNQIFEDAGAVVVGLSPDDQQSHLKFHEKFSLNFPLLVDKDHKNVEKYGSWHEKIMYGKKSMGIVRSTFLIDKDGKVAKIWKRVRVDGHDQKVLEAIKELE